MTPLSDIKCVILSELESVYNIDATISNDNNICILFDVNLPHEVVYRPSVADPTMADYDTAPVSGTSIYSEIVCHFVALSVVITDDNIRVAIVNSSDYRYYGNCTVKYDYYVSILSVINKVLTQR